MAGKITSSLLIILIILVNGCNTPGGTISDRSYTISEKKDSYIIRYKESQKRISEFQNANEALDYIFEKSGDQGARIHFAPGEYRFSAPATLASNSFISGDGTNSVIVPSESFSDSTLFMGDSLNEVTIQDLKLKVGQDQSEAVSGIILKNSGSCLLKDLTLIGFTERGIWLTEDCFLSEIRGCRFAEIGKSGVYLHMLNDIGRAGPYLPNLVANCIFFRGGTGIECSDAIVVNIASCMVFQSRGPAFHVNSASNSVLITGCRTFQIEDNAVVVDDSHEINITGNIFCWQIKNGIVLNNVDWGTISGNNIIDTGNIPYVPKEGEEWVYWQERPETTEGYQYTGLQILSDSKGLTINGNAIFNWASNPPLLYGIYEAKECSDNIIIGNNINYFTRDGIRSYGNGTLVADNISTAGAHRGNTAGMHSFDTRLIEQFIQEIW